MLVVDETGDLKKDNRSAGVSRQYTGTAGRIENAQAGVFLTYTTTIGHTLIDRELCLPRSWTGGTARCAAAGIPEDTTFATKPALASRMILRLSTPGRPPGGSPATRSAAATRHCAPTWRSGRPGTCRRWPVTTASPPLRAPPGSTNSLRGYRNAPGSGCPPGEAPRDTGSATGSGSPSPVATTRPRDIGGCWSGATAVPANWPATAAPLRNGCR
ncbi:transposase [Lentzea sp. NPDC004782]|uniref:transposase n=1 Tax=Lentzea sp. NPDC004782 TaxID=3154458 RepID=UPI0033A18067